MKLRSDSPFAGLKPHQIDWIVACSERMTLDELCAEVELQHPELEFSTSALKRFVRRVKQESLREEALDAAESMEDLAKSGDGGKLRDGAIEAMRQRMFVAALEAPTSAEAKEVFEKLKEEQKEDRELKLAERRMALEEEKARQVWRARELDAAASALKLLPRIRSLLCDPTEGTAEERMAKARELLMVGGAKLLGDGNG